mgnify:CR=1 FL=1
MKLTMDGIKNREAWEKAGIQLPGYDVKEISEKAKKEPRWVHFGIGNIFRVFIGGIADGLLEEGALDRGLTCVETFDYDVVDKIYTPYDNLGLSVILHGDGSREYKVLGSLAEAVKAQSSNETQWNRLKEIFTSKSLQMVSFTITEKGYALQKADGTWFPFVQADIENGPDKATGAMAVVVAMLYERYKAGKYPLALVSMDNCSKNGAKLRESVLTMAEEWKKAGFVEEGFVSYVSDEKVVAFPWTMIDKITPRPSEKIANDLEELGIEEMQPVITSKKTYIAPFVNAEGPQYLVIEDKFPAGRPALEKAGVYLTDRDTVNRVERMKVTTCLNPLHTALAVYGCLLGYNLIADEMNDKELTGLIRHIGYDEGMKVVTDPGILSPKAFIDEVIEKRLPNPFMPDTPQRIATDTSQKIVVRFGETMKSYMASSELDCSSLVYIPLAIAGWLRYLLGTDDKLEKMELSSDPMLANLQEKLSGVEAGKPETYTGQLKEILTNKAIFGVDMYEAGLADKVEGMFVEMLAGKDAVRNTLKKYVD